MRDSKMEALGNTAQTLSTRCPQAPARPRQRWCRQCLPAAQRERRAAQRPPQADAATTPVTHAPRQAMPAVTQEEAQEALAAYHNVCTTIAAYEAMSEQEWKRSPVPP